MEAKLSELVNRLKAAAGENVKAVVLYGSAVSGEFQKEHSDLNILCIVERAGAADIERLHPVAEWWMKERNPAPLIFTMEELQRSADVFAVEMVDIKRHHRMLLGTDFLDRFDVPMRLHGLQVERELRTGWLRLRQAILAAPQKKKVHLGIMMESVAAFCALFRHAMLAVGQALPGNKRESVDAAASLSGGNPAGFHTILDLRDGKRKEKDIDIEATLATYLEFVEVVTNEVDRRLDAI
jgi:predicted nucleotidyltransferase